MKKNLLLVALVTVLVPATFEVAAYRHMAEVQNEQANCNRCVKKVRTCCVAKAKPCKKACVRPASRCGCNAAVAVTSGAVVANENELVLDLNEDELDENLAINERREVRQNRRQDAMHRSARSAM